MRVINFPARGIGARSLEQLQDAARQYGISLYAAVPYVAGKAGRYDYVCTLHPTMKGRLVVE